MKRFIVALLLLLPLLASAETHPIRSPYGYIAEGGQFIGDGGGLTNVAGSFSGLNLVLTNTQWNTTEGVPIGSLDGAGSFYIFDTNAQARFEVQPTLELAGIRDATGDWMMSVRTNVFYLNNPVIDVGTITGNGGGLTNIFNLADPNADRIYFWDDSAGGVRHLTIGSGLNITGTTITSSGGSFSGLDLVLTNTQWNTVDGVPIGSLDGAGSFYIFDTNAQARFEIQPTLELAGFRDSLGDWKMSVRTNVLYLHNPVIEGTTITGHGGGLTNINGTVEVYSESGWNNDTTAPTKNDVRDKIESLTGGAVTFNPNQFSTANGSTNIPYDASLTNINQFMRSGTTNSMWLFDVSQEYQYQYQSGGLVSHRWGTDAGGGPYFSFGNADVKFESGFSSQGPMIGDGNSFTNLNPANVITNTPVAGDVLQYTSGSTAKATSDVTLSNITVLTASGNASGFSNAVDIIAGANVTITTNANKRSFTIAASAGDGGDGIWFTNAAENKTITNVLGSRFVAEDSGDTRFFPGTNSNVYIQSDPGEVSRIEALEIGTDNTFFIGDVNLGTAPGDFNLNVGTVADITSSVFRGGLEGSATNVNGNIFQTNSTINAAQFTVINALKFSQTNDTRWTVITNGTMTNSTSIHSPTFNGSTYNGSFMRSLAFQGAGGTGNFNIGAAGTVTMSVLGTNMNFQAIITATNGVDMTPGSRLTVRAGTGQRAGTTTLVNGTVTVNNTTVTANTLVMPGFKTIGGTTAGILNWSVSAGTSFTITSVSATGTTVSTDTSDVTYFLIENP